MAERYTGYQQQAENKGRTRRIVGTAAEYGGAAIGVLELISLNLGGALVGGAIWLIGRWTRYYGQEQPAH